MTNAVDIENVSLVFGGEGNNPVLAVDTINIAIPKGQFVAIVGPSGCGKTTTARLMTMLEEKTSGDIKFMDEDTKKLVSLDSIEEDQIQNFRKEQFLENLFVTLAPNMYEISTK